MRAKDVLDKYEQERNIALEDYRVNVTKIIQSFPTKEQLKQAESLLQKAKWESFSYEEKMNVKREFVRKVLKKMTSGDSLKQRLDALDDCAKHINGFTDGLMKSLEGKFIDGKFLEFAEYANNYLNHTGFPALSYVDATVEFKLNGNVAAKLDYHEISKSEEGAISEQADLEPDYIQLVKVFGQDDTKGAEVYSKLTDITFALLNFEKTVRDCFDDKVNGLVDVSFPVKNTDKSKPDHLFFEMEIPNREMLHYYANDILVVKAVEVYKLLKHNLMKLLPEVLFVQTDF